MAITYDSISRQISELYEEYDKNIKTPNFRTSKTLWIHKHYGISNDLTPEETRALFKARDPMILRFHAVITKARLIGIEVRGWP